MSDIAIKVENLSKRYRIGPKEELHDTFAGALTDFLRQPVKNMRRLRRLTTFSDDGHDAEDIIWALKDVSFEVKRGEVVGIIGRNGAGKSTLLKILSRITHPTSGRVTLNGRVSSLLEVGTGFHPELTGRENIYLNGTILGMTKTEIDKKFDEIVDFSGVEKFIDTPVKRYSSGMRVRLAFSVAAHLEPEILLVDEVLAVGDAAFQKKCLGKMGDVAREGRTVLFVSHNMGMIKELCSRGIFVAEGKILFDGGIYDAVAKYQLQTQKVVNFSTGLPAASQHKFGFKSWRILNSEDPYVLREYGYVSIEIIANLKFPVPSADITFVLQDSGGKNIAGHKIRGVSLNAGINKFVLQWPNLPVRPGIYYWYGAIWDPQKVDVYIFPQEFVIVTPDYHDIPDTWAGILNIPIKIIVNGLICKE